MAESPFTVCPYRTQVHDPSSIQTEQYEVQTQKFELQTQKYEIQAPRRFEVQQARYGEPQVFTGTEKDLALLAKCQAGSPFAYQVDGKLSVDCPSSCVLGDPCSRGNIISTCIEALNKDQCSQTDLDDQKEKANFGCSDDSDDESTKQDESYDDSPGPNSPAELAGDNEGQSNMDGGGQSKHDEGGGTPIDGEASISQPVTPEINGNGPEDVSRVPPAAPDPPTRDDDVQEQSLETKEVSGPTDTSRPTSRSSVHFADDTAPPAPEFKPKGKNNKQTKKEAKKDKKQDKKAKQLEKELEPEIIEVAKFEEDLPKSSKKGKEFKKDKKQDKKLKQADKDAEPEKSIEIDKVEDETPKGKKGKKGKKADKSWEPEPIVEKEVKEIKQEKGGKGKKDKKGGKGKEKAGKALAGVAVVGAAAAVASEMTPPPSDELPSDSPGVGESSPVDEISPSSDPAPSADGEQSAEAASALEETKDGPIEGGSTPSDPLPSADEPASEAPVVSFSSSDMSQLSNVLNSYLTF